MNTGSIKGLRSLNLGCGRYPVADHINVDIDAAACPDLLADLNHLPYPFQTSSFAYVYASHLLEHLDDPFGTMQEIHRILAPGGQLVIKVPHFTRGFTHPQHKRGFDVSFPLYFNKNFTGGYTGTEFELIGMHLSWFAQKELKKKTLSKFQYMAASGLSLIFDFMANLSPFACSRIWCFWVGGFEEIEFKFKALK